MIDGLRKIDCKRIADKSRQILNARNKTKKEEIFAYNITKGIVINGLEPCDEDLTATSSPEMQALSNCNDEYVIVHNHPNNGMPSSSDLTCLLKIWKNSKCCYVVCHNGDVWTYQINKKVSQPIDKVSNLEYNMSKLLKDEEDGRLNGTDQDTETAKRISLKYGLIIERR